MYHVVSTQQDLVFSVDYFIYTAWIIPVCFLYTYHKLTSDRALLTQTVKGYIQYNMDVYRAQADFHAPSRHRTVLSFKKGDGFEIFEKGDGENSWWGVRRLRGNKVGWVPSQYLKFDRQESEQSLPNNYHESRRHYVKRLGVMQKGTEHKLPDIYKLPPDGVQSIDDWRLMSSHSAGASDPEPDYTDEELEKDSAMAEIQQIGGMRLSREDWKKIKARADDDSEPEPDYEIPTEVRQEYEGRKDAEGLVHPKHLQNPVLKSSQRMDIHKELLWNQKRGIDVLHKKSELTQEMERRQTKKTEKLKENDPDRKTVFEKLLDDRAEKIKQKEPKVEAQKDTENETPEFLRVHSKIKRVQPASSH